MDILHILGPPVVAQGVGTVVQDALGLAGGAGGEIQQDRVFGGGGDASEDPRLLVHVAQQVQIPAAAAQGEADGHPGLFRRSQDAPIGPVLSAGDHALGLGLGHAVEEVLFRQQIGAGCQDQAQLVGGQGHDPPAPVGAQGREDHVAPLEAVAAEEVRHAIAHHGQVFQGQLEFCAPVVAPEHGQAPWLGGGHGVDDVIGVIKVVFVVVVPVRHLAVGAEGLLDITGVEGFHGRAPF